MRGVSPIEVRLWIGAAGCFAAFAALGAYVTSRPPTRIDLAAGALRGELIPIAAFFTALGRTLPLLGIALAVLVLSLALRRSVVPVLALVASQVLAQGAIAVVKPTYHRMRPDHWLLYHEKDFSFPSGHSATAIVFYAVLAWLFWQSPLPRPVAAVAASAAAICVVGLPWSRLALGAHYFTDVVGGLLFGCGWVCVASAIALRIGAR